MNANHEHFLIVGSVEDPDAAPRGEPHRRAPEIIVLEFLGGRLLEGMDVCAFRADPGHHVFDDVIFPSPIHTLEHQQQGVAVLGVQELLQRLESLEALLQMRERGFLAGERAGVIWPVTRQRGPIMVPDTEPVDMHGR